MLFLLLVICFHGAASVHVDVLRDRPRVAVLIVGKSFNSRRMANSSSLSNASLQDRGAGAGTTDATNMFDFMTGEDNTDDGDTLQFEREPGVVNRTWDNILNMLIKPVKKTHWVDVILCIDKKVNDVPPEVTHVFAISAPSQEERGLQCLAKIRNNHRTYEWLIKTRPDFMFYRPFPSMTSFLPGYVYTRFRAVAGISNLTSDHFSWDYCTSRCNAGPPGRYGYMNDDMVRVVPAALMQFAFRSLGDTTKVKTPQTWIAYKNFPHEVGLSLFWLERGIRTMPLACPGYPRHARYHHHELSYPCSTVPVKKNCQPNLPIQDVHKALV